MNLISKHGRHTKSWLRQCHGHCEGTGWFPTDDPSEWSPHTRPLGFPPKGELIDDGWRFVRCPRCFGTGKANLTTIIFRIPAWLLRGTKIIYKVVSYYDKSHGLSRWENLKLAIKIAYLVDLGLCKL